METYFKCPNCGSTDRLNTHADIGLTINGAHKAVEVPDTEEMIDQIDHNNDMTCLACGHSGLVFEFEDAANPKAEE